MGRMMAYARLNRRIPHTAALSVCYGKPAPAGTRYRLSQAFWRAGPAWSIE